MQSESGFGDLTAVVTGAGGGMGLNVARDLLDEGARVFMADLKPNPDGFDEHVERAAFHQGDVTDDDFVLDLMQEAFNTTGRLDLLVNAAGVLWFTRDGSLADIDLKVWDQVLDINLKSVVHTVRHAVPLMKKSGGGAMVHVSSTQCLRGDRRPQDAYQASKAAVIALSRSIAIQFAADGIRSNVLVPGPTESPMQTRWRSDPKLKKKTAAAVPLGRVGTTQNMSDAILFLLSNRASYITGTELVVDGGLLALP
ncbi:MAG TPA: SDR family oxidoreductase [Gammaproteobacteria bacterium]|nr:SDR family oxidoreductase [Gammaproteobacteria bacterium]